MNAKKNIFVVAFFLLLSMIVLQPSAQAGPRVYFDPPAIPLPIPGLYLQLDGGGHRRYAEPPPRRYYDDRWERRRYYGPPRGWGWHDRPRYYRPARDYYYGYDRPRRYDRPQYRHYHDYPQRPSERWTDNRWNRE